MSFPQTFPVPNLDEFENSRKDSWIQRTLVQFSDCDGEFPLSLALNSQRNSSNP
jgi:hypothetical protein